MINLRSAFQTLPVVQLTIDDASTLSVILGGSQPGLSFKDLLAQGMFEIAYADRRLREGQTVLIDSSGSAACGVALEGRMRGNPVVVVTGKNLPDDYRFRLKHLGAQLIEAPAPHPTGGWQESRRLLTSEVLHAMPNAAFFDQNNDAGLNVGAYERLLIPRLAQLVDPSAFDAAVFAVGSGGHFSAISKWLKQGNSKILTFAADREGSVTFGGMPKSSFLRGVGNMGCVPQVIASHLHLVDGAQVVSEAEAIAGCRELAQLGLFVGGSSGLVYSAALRLMKEHGYRSILTLFADRGEAYFNTPLFHQGEAS